MELQTETKLVYRLSTHTADAEFQRISRCQYLFASIQWTTDDSELSPQTPAVPVSDDGGHCIISQKSL